MKTKATTIGFSAALAVCLTVFASGCFLGPLGTLISAGLKVTNGQISTLTAAEIKVLNETAIGILNAQTGANLQPLTDEQAQAVANFLQANNLNTVEEIQQFAEQAEQDPGSVQGLDELAQAFQGTQTNIDPNHVDRDELNELFNSVFTGAGAGYPPP